MKHLIFILLLVLCLAALASASHPTLTPAEAVSERKETFTVWVPVTGTLEHVEVKVPKDAAGKPVFHVEFAERPVGWTVETKKAGDRISEIKWDAPKNTYKNGDLVSLRFMAETPATVGTYKFDVERHQTGAAEAHEEGKEESPEVKVVAKPSIDARLDTLATQVQQAQQQADQAQARADQASAATQKPTGIGLALVALLVAMAALWIARKKR